MESYSSDPSFSAGQNTGALRAKFKRSIIFEFDYLRLK